MEKIIKATEAVLHPTRVRQRALGELYLAAATRLRTGNTTFFPADRIWVANNHRRGEFETIRGTFILDTTVTADNKMPATPYEILMDNDTLTRAADGTYEMRSRRDGRPVPTRSVRRLANALTSEPPSNTK
jgi:hypothetical protein